MGFANEFRTFIMKGNVIDLAIGVIIGAAFSKIVNSLIEDVITPLLLKPVLERANLTELDKLRVLGTVKIGVFLSSCINFLIVALILFLIIRALNRFKKKEEPVLAGPSSTDKLLMEIRDELRKP